MNIKIYGPHQDGEYNMAINQIWIAALFDSHASAKYWSKHLDEAEALWRAQRAKGNTKPLAIPDAKRITP